MPQQELLNIVVQRLNELGISYMMTGSMVSSLQGEPRSTHDIDLVIALEGAQIEKLAHSFQPPDFYLSHDAIVDAVRTGTMFNLLSLSQGEKVDFWLLTDDAFERSRFARKRTEIVQGSPIVISSPEDTILAKLKWAKMSGGSEKQSTDALRVYEVQRANLDLSYLNQWASQLGIDDLWEKLQGEAEPL
jgi:hypothetical protein